MCFGITFASAFVRADAMNATFAYKMLGCCFACSVLVSVFFNTCSSSGMAHVASIGKRKRWIMLFHHAEDSPSSSSSVGPGRLVGFGPVGGRGGEEA